MIESAFRTACAILERNRTILEAGARELLARETLGPEDLARITTELERETVTKPTLVAAR